MQVILTGEPALVSLAASLLETVLQHNIAALATLSQTGIYFFGLAYCGSNLSELARLFKVWFLQQNPDAVLMQLSFYTYWRVEAGHSAANAGQSPRHFEVDCKLGALVQTKTF